MRRARAGIRGDEGVAAVEFGLVLPLFVLLVMGILEYGYLYYIHLNMTNAAREGARVGVVQEDPAAAPVAAKLAAESYLQATGVAATVSLQPFDGTTLSVDVKLDPYPELIGLVPTPDKLGANASMRYELAPR